MQNKAAVMHGTHDVRLEDVPVPEPGPNEVLIKVEQMAIAQAEGARQLPDVDVRAVVQPVVVHERDGGQAAPAHGLDQIDLQVHRRRQLLDR